MSYEKAFLKRYGNIRSVWFSRPMDNKSVCSLDQLPATAVPIPDAEEVSCKAAKEIYKHGWEDAQPQWISVKERLPEEGALTVIYMPMRREEHGHLMLEFFDGGDWYWGHTSVTHWMLVPKPPEEEA